MGPQHYQDVTNGQMARDAREVPQDCEFVEAKGLEKSHFVVAGSLADGSGRAHGDKRHTPGDSPASARASLGAAGHRLPVHV